MTVPGLLFGRTVGTRPTLSWRKRLAFSLMAVLLGVVLLEGLSFVVLVWFLGRPLWDLHDEQRRLSLANDVIGGGTESLHPYLGWVANPDTNPGSTVAGRRIPINAFGFADVERGIPRRQPGRLVIAVLGGSVAWQLTAFAEETLQAKLRHSTRDGGGDVDVEIVRLAMSGYKQPQQLLALAWLYSLGAEFDAVVNIDGYNELALPLAENYASGVSVVYPRMWHARMQNVVDPRVTSMSYRILEARAMRQRLAQEMCESPLRWSHAWNLLWYVRNSHWARQIVDVGFELARTKTRQGFGFGSVGPRDDFENYDAALARCVELWRESSVQIAEICRAKKIPYLHFLQPNQYSPGRKPMSAEERGLAIIEDQEYGRAIARGYPLLIEAGQSLKHNGIEFHDLTTLFDDVEEPVYVDPFCHYNAWGNERLADVVGERLRAALDAVTEQHSD